LLLTKSGSLLQRSKAKLTTQNSSLMTVDTIVIMTIAKSDCPIDQCVSGASAPFKTAKNQLI
jgi:hypothetical protein